MGKTIFTKDFHPCALPALTRRMTSGQRHMAKTVVTFFYDS